MRERREAFEKWFPSHYRTDLLAFLCIAFMLLIFFSFFVWLVEASSSTMSYLEIIAYIYGTHFLCVLTGIPFLYREKVAVRRVLSLYGRSWLLMVFSAVVAAAVLWWRYETHLWLLFDWESPMIRPYPFRGIAYSVWTFVTVWLLVSCAGMAFKLSRRDKDRTCHTK